MIKEVYGIEIEQIPYVSYQYTQWLDDMAGFSSVHYISVAQQLISFINGIGDTNLTNEQREASEIFRHAYIEAVSAFSKAANSMSDSDTHAMVSTKVALREAADICAQKLSYPGELQWSHNRKYWYNDPFINEYQLNWN